MNVNKNNSTDKQLFVGTSLVQVLAFNPSRLELDKVLNITRDADYEPKAEFEYVKEDQEVKLKSVDDNGEEVENSIFVNKLTVTVWVRELKNDKIFPMNFSLYNTNDVAKSGKLKFITQHGKSTYANNESDLQDWFKLTPGKKKFALDYRIAKKGEASLLEFLAAWTNISPFDVGSSLFLENEKRFWSGDMKELNSLISDFEDNSVMVNFGVRTKIEEDETKEYQTISTKAFCNSAYMKFFRSYANKNWEGLLLNDPDANHEQFNLKAKVGGSSMYQLANYMNNLFGQFGVSEYTVKEEIREYNSEENPVNNETHLVGADEELPY